MISYLKKINDLTKLICFGILSELIYLSFIFINFYRKKIGDTSLVLSIDNLYFFITGLLLLLFVIYYFLSNINFDRKKFQIGLIFFGIFSLTTCLTYPLTSIDVFTYIHTSRVLSVHHANPYTSSFDDFSDEFSSQIANCWSDKPTPYAPLFTIISSGLTFIGQNNLFFSLYLFKVLFCILNILSVYLIYKITLNYKATILYAWNPILLFELVLNAHNDILTIVLLLVSLYFFNCKQNNIKYISIAFFFLLLSSLIKYITAILLPVFFIIAWRRIEDRKQKINTILYLLATSIFTLTVFYYPFWEGTTIFSRLVSQAGSFSPNWLFSSPLIIILSAVSSLFQSENIIANATQASKYIFIIFYVLFLIYLFFNKHVSSHKAIFYFAIPLLMFYISFFTWLMPWYLTVLIALAILTLRPDYPKKYFYFLLGLSSYSALYYLLLR